MEVFEIKKKHLERQTSTASSHGHGSSKVGYVLTMAGIILFTMGLLVFLHFTREYSYLTEEIEQLPVFPNQAERLEEGERCEEPYCNSKECVYIAATMAESINPKIDPCTDFYGYACGRYPRVKEVPYGMDFHSPLKDAQLRMLIDIRKTMDNPPPENETVVIQKMRKFYTSCTNTSMRDELLNNTLSFWFKENKIAPEGYVLGDPLEFNNTMHWTGLVSYFEKYRIHTLFKPHFVEKEEEAPYKLEIDCRIPFLKPEAYLDTTDDQLAFQMVMYREGMAEALQLLKLGRQERHEFVDEIIKIETDIARALLNVESSSESSSSDLNEENKLLLKEIWSDVVGKSVEEMELVSTCDNDLNKILTVLKEIPNRSAFKYVTWRMLMQVMQHLGTDFRGIHLHYMSKLPDTDYVYESIWKQCADVLRTELGFVTTKSLMDIGYIKKEVLDAVNEQFLEIKRDITHIFRTIQGVDDSTIKMFLYKIKGIKLAMGYPDILNQDGNLDTIYEGWDVDEDYFMNIIKLKQFKARKHLTRLWYRDPEIPLSEISLDDSPLGTSSSYDHITNTVHADLGLFKPPMFVHSENVPGYLNYGYSSILAREMVQAFDAIGTFFDAQGQRFEKISWPTSMEQRYDNAVSCIRNQTELLKSVVKVDIDNIKTLNNILVDLGSFLVPFEGLKSHLRSHLTEKPLPGVPLNKKQTFYVQMAQMFCKLQEKPSSDPEEQFRLPPKYRVNRAIANMEDFGGVFSCPPNSAMTSADRCNLFN